MSKATSLSSDSPRLRPAEVWCPGGVDFARRSDAGACVWRRSVDAMQQTQGDLAAARARAVAAEDAEKKKAEEADLGGAESVSETVGQVFAGYQCGSVTVRALDRHRLLRRAPVPSRPTFPAPRTPREPRVGCPTNPPSLFFKPIVS